MRLEGRPVTLIEDIIGQLVPGGEPIKLSCGQMAVISQAKGMTMTLNVQGNLVRVASSYIDALNLPQASREIATAQAVIADIKQDVLQLNEVQEDHLYALMRFIFDPEIPVNVVDLGLIYAVDISPIAVAAESSSVFDIKITMTLTAPGCGMGPVLVDEIKQAISQLPLVQSIEVDLVFDPPWDRGCLSESAKLELGLI